jgi:YkoY family integral membrane protein
MEAESIPSLSPLIESADRWGEWLLLLPLLVALEAVLSADNAIALAAISRQVRDPSQQNRALNLGLGLALVFRLALIGLARWVLDFWPLQLLAAAYLLWLCLSNLAPLLSSFLGAGSAESGSESGPEIPSGGDHAAATLPHPPHDRGLRAVVTTLALTDLAFSLDSVAAAVAVSDNLLLVMAGGVIGVVALRLTSALFIRWLEDFERLETAGYLAVGLVGLRLVLRVLRPDLVPPEWLLLALVALLFAWGFSRRTASEGVTTDGGTDPGTDPGEVVP